MIETPKNIHYMDLPVFQCMIGIPMFPFELHLRTKTNDDSINQCQLEVKPFEKKWKDRYAILVATAYDACFKT